MFLLGALVWEVSHRLFYVLVHPLMAKAKFLSVHLSIEREGYPTSAVPVTPRSVPVIASLQLYMSLPDPFLSLPDLIGQSRN
jgi:hypothetical protein